MKTALPVGTSNEHIRISWVGRILAGIPAGWRILDAGAGEKPYEKFCQHLDYVAQDFGRYDGKGDGKGLQTGVWDQFGLDIVSDIIKIPEPNGSFGAILCTEVFEHLPDPISVIGEFNRLLEPGGYLILTVPFCSLTHYAPFHFYSGFSRYFFDRYLQEFGFQILECEENGNYFEYIAQEMHRIKKVAARYASDQPGILERMAVRVMLRMLERFSRKDQGSRELLCFGYHILAQKKIS